MKARLLRARTFEGAIETILTDTMALQGAERGNIQLVADGELLIVCQRGFGLDFLKTFERVDITDGSACGRALRMGAAVVVEDVETDAKYAPLRAAARSAGYRAVQSTPLKTSGNATVGMASTHFSGRNSFNCLEMEILKSYGTIAADYLLSLVPTETMEHKVREASRKLYS